MASFLIGAAEMPLADREGCLQQIGALVARSAGVYYRIKWRLSTTRWALAAP
jgi:hypothetical protein